MQLRDGIEISDITSLDSNFSSVPGSRLVGLSQKVSKQSPKTVLNKITERSLIKINDKNFRFFLKSKRIAFQRTPPTLLVETRQG